MTTTMTIRLNDETKTIIKDLAEKQAATPSRICRELLEAFCKEYVSKQSRYSDVA